MKGDQDLAQLEKDEDKAWSREESRRRGGWIGVDLDGTLAHYERWDDGKIGKPIKPMVDRVKRWLSEGKDVRIFTARASDHKASTIEAIEAWCKEHIGRELPVTNTKDFGMIELWDDRAVQVVTNTGSPAAQERA